MGSKGSNTTTTSSSPPAWVNAAYQDIYGRANQTAQTPYSAYAGEQVAGFSPDQQAAFQNVNNAQGMAQPYINQGMMYNAQGAAPVANLDANMIAQYQNPYQSMVTDATMANINETNTQQMQKLQGNAALQGAMGGDRMGVAKAELARQQNLSNNQTLANLTSSGFDKAAALGNQAVMNQQQNAGRAAQAAYGAGSLGSQAQGAALQGAQAQLATGAQQQQLTQAQLSTAYQQWMEQQAFPYQQTQWLAGIGSGVGSGAGGTSSTTAPAPSPLGQIAGVAASAAGAYFSDERLKEGVEHVGELFDGQPVYRYNYKGDPRTQIGLLAQDVEQSEPEAVGQAGGFKTVDYNAATDAAAVRGSFAQGGMAGTPWSGAGGYIPQGGQITRGSGPPKPPSVGSGNAENMMGRAAGMASDLTRRMRNSGAGDPMDLSAPGVDSYSPAGMGDIMPPAPMSGFGPIYSRGGPVGFADGGSPFEDDYPSFGDRWAPTNDALASGDFDPVGRNNTGAYDPATNNTPMAPEMPPQFASMNQPTATPVQTMRYSPEEKLDPIAGGEPPVDTTVPVAKTTPGLEPRPPLPPPVDANITADDPSALNPQGGVADSGGGKKRSGINWRGPFSDDWQPNMPLITAGLGMLASRSPNFGNVIGDGGLAGVQQYGVEKKAEALAQNNAENRVIKKAEIANRLQQLKDQAKYHADQLRETTRGHDLTDANQKATIASRDANQKATIAARGNRPFIMGTDPDTMLPVYGINGPDGKPVPIDPRTGQPRAAAPQRPADDPGEQVTGDAYLKTQPPEESDMIKKLADYEADPKNISIKNNRREVTLKKVMRYDPSYDVANFPARSAAIKEFKAGGVSSPAGQITAGTTAIQHAGELSDAVEKYKAAGEGSITGDLGAAGIPFVSYAANLIRNASVRGTPEGAALKEIMTARNHFAEEVTKFYAGSGGSESERKRALDAIDAAGSVEELRAAIHKEANLMQGKVDNLQSRWQTALGPSAYQRNLGITDFPIHNEKTLKALERINSRNDSSTAPPAAAEPKSADPLEGRTATDKSGKKKIRRNGKWEDMP